MTCQTIRELENVIVSRRLPPLENSHRTERNPRNQRNATHEMTCPVCYEQTDLLKVCGNGHDLCRDCLGKCWNMAQTCPQCREPMTDAYAEAGLLNRALRFGPPEPGRDDFDTEDDYENWLADQAENVQVDIVPRAPRLRDDLTTERHIYNPYTHNWIRNTNANRQRILGNGGHEPWHRAIYEPPEIVQVPGNNRRPGDRYVIAGLEMIVVRDLRVR